VTRSPWQPAAGRDLLQARAALLARIRAHLAAAGVLEVETPLVSRAAVTDPALESMSVIADGVCGPLYLHTSPEFAMKRLLAAGSGPIYQICKVFRDKERGRVHHPEFTLLEWYRPGWDYRQLIEEVAAVVRVALQRPALPAEILTYRELFVERLGVDPWLAGPEDLRRTALEWGIAGAGDLALSRDGWLDLLLSHCLEAGLGAGRLTFVCDYPPSQAALSRVRPGDFPAAERFELYLEGMELANGFQELTDPAEQRCRFSADLQWRRALGMREPPLDEAFLAALGAGLPESAGVALGIDRLLMVLTGSDHIDQVLAFPVERA
jgi:elongation factor P--(R)-beta-lysine ligase